MALRFSTFKTYGLILRLTTCGTRAANGLRGLNYKIGKNIDCVRPSVKSIERVKCPEYSSQRAYYCTSRNKGGKIYIEFTCKKCDTRNKKFMSKVAYNSGVVIITCEGCRNNHLIADNLNWFTDLNGKRNVEEILKEKGESVKKLLFSEEGVSEIVSNQENSLSDK